MNKEEKLNNPVTVNIESKNVLAKLMATENIHVEHKKVKTASFDVKNRVLRLPLWEKMDDTMYEGLIGHEVGHALYTPDAEWSAFAKENPSLKDYANILEDARIERKMKIKYPGMKRTFFSMYNDLNQRDFFGTKERDLDSYGFGDRLNMHFKLGLRAEVPFSDEEKTFAARVMKAETFEDILELTRELGDITKAETETNMEDLPFDFDDLEPDSIEEEDGESENSNTPAPSSDSEDESDEESDNSNSSKPDEDKDSEERDTYPELEQIQGGEKEFIDERGKISNYELTEPINLIGYIESKAGTVRANHFHPIQEQKCLLVKGKYVSVLKDLSDPNAVIETNIINAGDLSSIHPNVAHTMVFLEDSIFLNLVRGEREHKNYGVTHTMFYELVDEKFRETILDCYKFECRSCGNEHLKQVVSLGMSPLANNLLKNIHQEEELFPLEMNYCPNCHNCQLSFVVSPEKMFDNYLYVSSTSKIFRHHFSKLADILVKDFKLNEKSLVLDIGSNDGIFLKPLKEKGIGILGIDPAKNVSELANKDGIETITGYFNETTANVILKDKGPVDLITAFNVFAHSDDLEGIAKNSFNILKDEGTLIIEVQYLLDTIKDLTFDNIYHEHVNYWSVTSMDYFFKKLNLQIFKVEHVDTHGGSIRAYVRRDKNDPVDASVETFLTNESNFGIKEFDTYKAFGKQIEDLKEETLRNLNHLKDNKKTIIGEGCLIMAYVHLAHDCMIGNEVVIVNGTELSGHIIVEDRAFVSGMVGAHQFVRFGKLSMTGGMSRIVKDILPFCTVEGSPARLIGTNAVGLKRAGMAPAIRSGIKKAVRFLMHNDLNTTQAIKKIEEEIEISDEIRYLINFVNNSDRGIIR